MRYTVQYIPLSKIKPGLSVQMTRRMNELRRAAQDCMHLMVVRRNKKAGGYIIVSGNNHFDFLRKHTNKKVAPCLVDEDKASSRFSSFIHRLRKRKLPYEVPYLERDRIAVKSWTIIRAFMKQEPRFKQLTPRQQLKVLRLGLRYKRTTISSMRAKVDEMLKRGS